MSSIISSHPSWWSVRRTRKCFISRLKARSRLITRYCDAATLGFIWLSRVFFVCFVFLPEKNCFDSFLWSAFPSHFFLIKDRRSKWKNAIKSRDILVTWDTSHLTGSCGCCFFFFAEFLFRVIFLGKRRENRMLEIYLGIGYVNTGTGNYS